MLIETAVRAPDAGENLKPQDDTRSTAAEGFRRDLMLALARTPHRISPKYFYDAEGSRLFDRICELPEYYPTRTELGILARHAGEIAHLMGEAAEIVEFGAGALRKVRLLLDAARRPAGYLPIDISGEHLSGGVASLRQDYPGLRVEAVVADYTRPFSLPPAARGAGRRVGFFPGSTIGNFTPDEALVFLRQAGEVLHGGGLLIGADLVKAPAVLHAAYNDAQGVTAAFNLNLLGRANRELGARFELARFAHAAFYNPPLQRVEMHLMSLARQTIALGGECYELAEGESLHTENSYKFTVEGLQALARRAGFRCGPVWTDADRLFSVHWLHAPGSQEER